MTPSSEQSQRSSVPLRTFKRAGRGAVGLRASVALALVASLCSGCSWIAMKKPAPAPKRPSGAVAAPAPESVWPSGAGPAAELAIPPAAKSCTSSTAAPVVDTVVSVIGGLAALGGLVVVLADASSKGPYQGVALLLVGLPATVGGLALAIPYGLSASDGFEAAQACSQQHPGQQDSVGWKASKRGTFVLSPLAAGLKVDGMNFGARTSFFLSADLEYYLGESLSLGLTLGGDPTGGWAMLDVGPQLKWTRADPEHRPYLRLAFPVRVFRGPRYGSYGAASAYDVGLAVPMVGAGYRYWANQRAGFGFDVSYLATAMLTGGSSAWSQGLTASLALDLHF